MRRGRFAAIGAIVLLVGGMVGPAVPAFASAPHPVVHAPRLIPSSRGTAAHPSSRGATNVRALMARAAAPLPFDPTQSNAVLTRLQVAQVAAARKREHAGVSPNSGPPFPPELATDAGGPAAATPIAAAGQTESGSGGLEPADSGVAVGPDNVIEADGQSLLFTDRLGNSLGNLPLPDFFALTEPPDATFTTFDAEPQVHFDQTHQRWIITELSWDCATATFSGDPAHFGHGFIDYAISNTSDPLGSWTSAYFFWNDFLPELPSFGESTDKLALTAGLFNMGPGGSPTTAGCGSGAFQEEHPIIMDWASLAPGFDGSVVPDSEFGDPTEDALQVANGDTDLSSDLRFVGRANGVTAGETEGDVIVLGASGSVVRDTLNLSAFNATLDDSVQGFAVPPSPQQPGGALSSVIDGGPQSVAYRDGGLFVSSTYPCTPAGDTVVRDCMRVLTLAYLPITAEPAEIGDVLLGTNGFDDSFGGLAQAGNADLIAVYTQSSATSDPSSFERHHLISDVFLDWSTPGPLTTGLGAYTGSTGWGDYLTVATDPQVPGAVWVGDPAAALDGSWLTTVHELVVGDTGAGYVALSPVRVLDTRAGTGLSHPMVANTPRSFLVGGFKNKAMVTLIPGNAVAITANLTVTGATAGGYVALSPLPSGSPSTEALSFPTGDNRANNVTIGLAPGGTLAAVYRAASGKHADLILDVTGYFLAGAGERYSPISPVRILDSRSGLGTTKFHANLARSFLVAGFTPKGAGSPAIPADAVAISANLTITDQTVAGHVTVTPTPTNHPGTSTINFPLKDNRANGLTIPIDPLTHKVSAVFTAASGTVDLTMDVTGYYSAAVSGLLYHPLDPGRRVDTRLALGTDGLGNGLTGAQAQTPRPAVVAGHLGVPADAAAITGNLTITGQTALGHITITPVANANPITSTLNFPLGDTRSNGVTVPLAATEVWFVYQGAAGKHVQVILDLTGYFE